MKEKRIFFLVSCIAMAVIFFTGCHQNTSVPPHLIGKWNTSDPRYRERYLKFEEGFLTFGTGKGQEVSHYIYDIKIEQHNRETVYEFHYRDHEGEKWTLSFVYADDYGGILQIKNRSEIWKKSDSGET